MGGRADVCMCVLCTLYCMGYHIDTLVKFSSLFPFPSCIPAAVEAPAQGKVAQRDCLFGFVLRE